MNNAVMNLAEPQTLLGDWHRDPEGRVVAVICECGNPMYYQRKIHSRLVDPEKGAALCKRCKEWVRVPVRFSNQ
jgi:hypothetical protein